MKEAETAQTAPDVARDPRYEAVRSRDARFDGVFYTAVLSTGIYCRPSCPAVTPKPENVRFLPTAAAAQATGFRACRRCRPDAVPGSAEWNQRADVVGRAMRMIADGVVDRAGVGGLARRLGYSSRQVQRQLTAELGAGPVALARAQRAHGARVLLQTTQLPVTEVAFAAGFASVRQFNETLQQVYARTPSALRAAAPHGTPAPGCGEGLALRLAHRGPYAAGQVFDFLQRRAVPGVEEVTGVRGRRTYRRTLLLPHGRGIAAVDEPGTGDGRWLATRLRLTDLRDLTTAVERVRALFDLDADPYAVAEHLGAQGPLAPLFDAGTAEPGLRAPGAADAHELAVRAVLGQQVSVAAARTLAGRLTAAHGEPLDEPDGGLTHLFPTAEALAEAPLTELGMPRSRRAALHTLTAALAEGTVVLDAGVDRAEAERNLRALSGIGPWTAGYIRMRALRDPDVFLDADAGVRHGLAVLGADRSQVAAWRPWRSYAVHHLWRLAAAAQEPTTAAPELPAVAPHFAAPAATQPTDAPHRPPRTRAARPARTERSRHRNPQRSTR